MINIRIYQTDLSKTVDLIQISKSDARKEFELGRNIYIRLGADTWCVTSKQDDEIMRDFEYGIKYFVPVAVDENNIIVTRHKNIVDYFKSKGISGKVMEIARPSDVKGKTIYGNCPMHLVAMAKEAYVLRLKTDEEVNFDEIPYSDFDKLCVEFKRYVVESELLKL